MYMYILLYNGLYIIMTHQHYVVNLNTLERVYSIIGHGKSFCFALFRLTETDKNCLKIEEYMAYYQYSAVYSLALHIRGAPFVSIDCTELILIVTYGA